MGQSKLRLTDSTTIIVQSFPYKTQDRLYFMKSDSLFFIRKSKFLNTTIVTWDYEKQKMVVSPFLTNWDNLKASKAEFENFNLSKLHKNYANRSSAGIVMTLVVPAVTSFLALQQGVVEIAYIGLASSAIGVGIWLSGINQLRIALDLNTATQWNPK